MTTAPHPPQSAARGRGTATPARPSPVGRNRNRGGVIIGTLLALLLLTGCGIRLETAAPTALVPDSDEIARQAMVSDLVAITGDAKAALATTPTDSATAAVLATIAATADAHTKALGGVYISGIADSSESTESTGALPVAEPTSLEPGSVTGTDGTLDPSLAAGGSPAPAPTMPPAPSIETVLTLLEQSATRSRGSLTTPHDPALARVFASITASELDSARALAAAAGIDMPVTEAFATSLPTTLPPGVAAADLTTLVRSEDAAGYAYEVMAARMTDTARTAALSRAQVHRARAQTWAELSSLDGTTNDPRHVAYTLPTAPDGTSVLTDPQMMADLAVDLENTLAASYTTFVGQVDANNRPAMLDLLVECRHAATSWGAPLEAFPGMPEQH